MGGAGIGGFPGGSGTGGAGAGGAMGSGPGGGAGGGTGDMASVLQLLAVANAGMHASERACC